MAIKVPIDTKWVNCLLGTDDDGPVPNAWVLVELNNTAQRKE